MIKKSLLFLVFTLVLLAVNGLMQQKITTSTSEKINLKSVLKLLFWSVIVGLTFYFIVGHAVGYLTNGIPKYFGPQTGGEL